MTTTEEQTLIESREEGLPIPTEVRSRYPEFDWDFHPTGLLIYVMNNGSYYFTPTGSDEVFFFTAEGFWYSNKRFPRIRPSVARKWPSEEPCFDFDVSVPPYYFIGRDINVEVEAIVLRGRPFKPNYELRDRDRPYVLCREGYIKRITWSDVPDNVKLVNRPHKFVQSFRNKRGEERVVETGLNKDGETFVLVNEEIEAEMDDDPWWADNQNVLQLERKDGITSPCRVHQEQALIDTGSDISTSEEDSKSIIGVMVEKMEHAKIDEGVAMGREESKDSDVAGEMVV